ncbi:MAG TPA: class F sortase [Candidatus Saccharimonadales bacterium]
MLLGWFDLHQKPIRVVTQINESAPKQASSQALAPKAVDRGLPVRLEIPKLKISAVVVYMGITKAGAMQTPNNAIDVGWYKYGPLPGNSGSAVIAGHIDGIRGEPGVFSNLDALQPGDPLTVADTQGRSTSFVVREVRTYDQNEQPTEVFNSSNGHHLNLITCAGDWDTAQHHFSKRLVVFTDKSD